MGALFKVYKSDGITEITNIKSAVFREAVNTGEHLTPGCVSSAEIEVEVFNTQANAVSAGDVVYAYVYDNANNGTLLGKFNCEPKIDTKNSYKFTAYDNALKLEADFSQWLQANQSNFPYTVKQLVQQACTIAGVTLGSSSWPLSSQSVQAFYADGLTCRDILSYAAELAGRFVRCHTDGNIYFDWYAASANSIAPSAGTGVYAYKQDGLAYANYTTTALARVAVHPSGEDDVAYIYPTGISTGNTLHIKNNLLLTGADASFYNAAAQQVYTAVTAVGSYCPMSVNLFPRENPFRAGDIVSITDAQSVTISAPITGMTISNAAATLVSEGRETYEDTNETAKAITQLASDVVRINKLKVDWADINTAIVNYLTANNVTAQNLTIVDGYGNVLATYDENGITLGDLAKGHAELDYHSFKLYDATGNLYVEFKDLRDADGKYEIVETFTIEQPTGFVRVEEDISSVVSVKRNNVVVPPSQYSFSSNVLAFQYALSVGDVLEVDYKTATKQASYTLGTRKSGEAVGIDSFSVGSTQTASGSYSSAVGGSNNEASGHDSCVVGGYTNNSAGDGSVVVGGQGNNATGDYAVVVGGQNNTSSGTHSIVSGIFNEANHKNQFVFGEYNETDPSTAASGQRGNYVEIVGNGTADNARSNARTLDWSGSETLAGGLTTGGNVSVTGDVSVSGDVGGATATISGNASVGGMTSSGNVVVSKSGDTYVEAVNSDTGCRIEIDSTTGGASGVWSSGYNDGTYHASPKWLVRRKTDGSVEVDGNCTGTAANVTGTVAVANGGTGATDAASALAALGGCPIVKTDITGNSSATFAISNSGRGVLVLIGAAVRGMYLVNATSSGGISTSSVLAATGATLNTSTNNRLTVSVTGFATAAMLTINGTIGLV